MFLNIAEISAALWWDFPKKPCKYSVLACENEAHVSGFSFVSIMSLKKDVYDQI